MNHPRLRWVAVTAAAALATTAPAAQAAKANLTVTKVSNPPKTAVPGGKFRVADTVRNKGGKRAARTATRFYLSADRKRGLGDLLMGGAREVPALEPRASSTAPKRRRTNAIVDVGTPAGRYFMLACADDREAVRESKEGDNCRPARRKVRVAVPVFVTRDLRFDALTDTTPEIALEQDEPQIVGQRQFRCMPAPKARVPSLDKAIDNIKSTIESRVGKADYAAFRRSKDHRKPRAATEAAMAAFLLNQPGAALAAMVRAHELEPRDASHLLNAAGLASSVGMHTESLALLDAAELRDDRQRPPMGINRTAMSLATRAHALASLGNYAGAVRMADAAVAIEPLLSEAARTAGMAELCANRPTAVARIRKARKRQPGKEPSLDDSRGKETELRKFPLPATPSEAVAINDFYKQQSDNHLDEIMARNARESQLRRRVNAKQAQPGYAVNQKLLHAVRMASAEPRLAAMRRDLGQRFNKAHFWWQDVWCDGDSCHDEKYAELVASCSDRACRAERCIPATKGWHQGWLNDQRALLEAAQAYVRALTKRMSGLASHIGDPDVYGLAMIAIEEREADVWSTVHQPAWYWTDWTDKHRTDCVEGFQPVPTDGTAPGAPQGSGPCPTGLQSFNFVIPLDVLSVKVNCSEIQIGASTTKWLGGFAEVTHNFRTGKSTMFAGVQAGVKAGPLKADFKSGIYMTSSNAGIEDVGMRAGPSVSAGAGPLEVSGPSDYVDISFVPVFASN